MTLWNSFPIAFSVLLPLINPLGSAFVFLGLVGEAPTQIFRSLARRSAINNVIFLAIIELLGATILNFFCISLSIVQLSGGVVIAALGWGMLNERSADANCKSKVEETGPQNQPNANRLEEGVFYPFTFPITSGPGTLVGLLTVTAHISNSPLKANILGHAGVFAAVVVITILCYLCCAYAPKITKAIPQSTVYGILVQ